MINHTWRRISCGTLDTEQAKLMRMIFTEPCQTRITYISSHLIIKKNIAWLPSEQITSHSGKIIYPHVGK